MEAFGDNVFNILDNFRHSIFRNQSFINQTKQKMKNLLFKNENYGKHFKSQLSDFINQNFEHIK